MENNEHNSGVCHVFECPCYPITESDIHSTLDRLIRSDSPGYSVAVNAEKIYNYGKNSALKRVIDNSVLPYPDGAGAVLGLRWLNGKKSEKINMPIRALEFADIQCLSLFIYGAKEESHNIAVSLIKKRFPNIDLVGSFHGYNDPDVVKDAIAKVKPDLILVALGSPRQELFAASLLPLLTHGLVIGCGGALDILAGNLKRAPKILIDNNLEWCYRLVQEPWRWRRQVFLFPFFFKLVLKKLSRRID